MANAKRKGSNVEAHAIAFLERLGYRVERARPVYRYVKGKPRATKVDFFTSTDSDGMRKKDGVDLVAKKPGCRTLWVQVKSTSSDAYGACKALRDGGLFTPEYDDVQVWEWLGAPSPGRPGRFLPRRLDDDFATNRDLTFNTTDTHFLWEDAPPCSTNMKPLF